jgi:mannose-6-phosphate isomerase
MSEPRIYPLRFEPIFQYRLWGGRRLENWLTAPLPVDGPIGEAWLLSDRDENPSRVAEGPFKGRTIAELMEQSPRQLLGKLAPRFRRFPLLLKFLDVAKMLSVQVHPPDSKTDLIPKGETGKTEAWVVLEATPESRVYAGLLPGVTATDLRAISQQTADNYLASFTPVAGQSVLIEAGTVHSIGGGLVVFEVQENSDVTFRLYDWDHIDAKTGRPRPLQVDQALACIDFAQGAIQPASPIAETNQPTSRERLIDCSHFRMWRVQSAVPFNVGETDAPRILVCIGGSGAIEYEGDEFAMEKGTVMLLPAAVGVCRYRPAGLVTLLELAVPELP